MSTHVEQGDVQRARRFLTEILQEEYPDLNFSPGSALSDTTVDANAHIGALFRKEAADVRRSISLSLVRQLDEQTNIDQSVENILANWYLSRNEGAPVRGTVLVQFSRQHAGSVPPDASFTRNNLTYTHDSDSPLFYDATQLDRVLDASGEVRYWVLEVPVVAEDAGVQYEIEPGAFTSWTDFSDYIVGVENDHQFFGGENEETTEEFIERGQKSTTSRDFSSPRSIDTLLRNQYGFVRDVITKGAGDDGMERDRVEVAGNFYGIRSGGKTDVYVTTPVVERKNTRQFVGEEFVDATPGDYVFDDENIDDWRVHVDVGDVIRVWNNNVDEPDRYIIDEVAKDFVRVDGAKPFPEKKPQRTRDGEILPGVINDFTHISVSFPVSDNDVDRYIQVVDAPDSQDVGRFIRIEDVNDDNQLVLPEELEQTGNIEFYILTDIVEYSIGDIAPRYENKVPRRKTGVFTDVMSYSGVIKLPEEPIYFIREVSLIDTDTGERVVFPNRQNIGPRPENGSLSYRVFTTTPQRTGSDRQNLFLQVGQAPIERTDYGQFVSGTRFQISSSLNADQKFDDPADEGKHIIVRDAFNPENRGEFEITNVVDPTTVEVENIVNSGQTTVPERRIRWELSERHVYDGEAVRVKYDSVQGFDVLSSFMNDPSRKILPSDKLLKAPHGVYLSFNMEYSLKTNVSAPNESDMKRHLIREINQFPADETLHTSEIVSFIQNEFDDAVDSVKLPITVHYRLFAPTGDVVYFETEHAIEMTENNLESNIDISRLRRLTVRPDTIRYVAIPELITLTEV